MFYLLPDVRVIYARPLEQYPITHYGGLFMIHGQK